MEEKEFQVKKNSRKKIIGNALFVAAVFALTVYGVFHGEDLEGMMDAIREADIRWLIPGAALVLFFIWGESVILWHMLGSFGIRLKKRICFLFSSVGFFFSCITPSASGGQPMQIYYMKKEKIPIPVAAVILMVVTITYKLVLVVIGLGVVCFGRNFLHRYLEGILPVFYLGLALNVFCVTFMTVLVFHPVLTESILRWGMKWLERRRFLKRKKERGRKLGESMEVYRETALYLKEHAGVIWRVIFVTFVQRMALFAVTWTVYQAFGMRGTSVWDVVFLQAVISVSVDMLPLPGGMGISEALFMNIFAPVFGTVLLPAMVLSRGMGYYGELLISAFFTIAAQLYYTFRRAEKRG
nr:lysylphosphatidylglycerol synthase transmembrane domain-containing protein [uncultured Acetatifactor sp.]